MKFLLRFILALPLLFLANDGLIKELGRDEWFIVIPIMVVVIALYDYSEKLKNEQS